ncbi:hypothetical protein [Isoalcanivorax indicus]|uniref:hypothetical protein n=1 Tax=Isoalcanivorax indicus TaxID=2202653 RepID=UPI0013C4E4BA|nr:hypothetical protein [Isoalcanivorax indicus]
MARSESVIRQGQRLTALAGTEFARAGLILRKPASLPQAAWHGLRRLSRALLYLQFRKTELI